MKRLNNRCFIRLLFGVFQFMLLILLMVPAYSQEYTQSDLDTALKNGAAAY